MLLGIVFFCDNRGHNEVLVSCSKVTFSHHTFRQNRKKKFSALHLLKRFSLHISIFLHFFWMCKCECARKKHYLFGPGYIIWVSFIENNNSKCCGFTLIYSFARYFLSQEESLLETSWSFCQSWARGQPRRRSSGASTSSTLTEMVTLRSRSWRRWNFQTAIMCKSMFTKYIYVDRSSRLFMRWFCLGIISHSQRFTAR